MKLWVPPWRCPPPHNETIFARYGASFCWVAYSRIFDRWMLIANGREEIIEPPPLWLCDGEYFAAHEINGAQAPEVLDKPRLSIRKTKKPQQLGLGFPFSK